MKYVSSYNPKRNFFVLEVESLDDKTLNEVIERYKEKGVKWWIQRTVDKFILCREGGYETKKVKD